MKTKSKKKVGGDKSPRDIQEVEAVTPDQAARGKLMQRPAFAETVPVE